MNSSVEIVVKAGSAGGSMTLLGQPMPSDEWRFAQTTVDHTAELVGDADVPCVGPPSLEWVDSWEEGLRLLDRYPWVRLHPLAVHPEFVEPLRGAVVERLALISDRRERELAREKWERVISAAEVKTQ